MAEIVRVAVGATDSENSPLALAAVPLVVPRLSLAGGAEYAAGHGYFLGVGSQRGHGK